MIKHKHQQLFDLLLEEFENGLWPRGEKLPSQKELARRYSVSGNVVSQTLELLKQERLVTIKKGDGIYSAYSPNPGKMIHKYSGERVFGRYEGAKTLAVLIEDYQDWQLEFWNKFFDEFSRENPDIELNVYYDHCCLPESGTRFDIAIGGNRFIAGIGEWKERVLHEEALDFYPELDDDFWLTTKDFEDGIFPIGFVSSYLLSHPGASEPLPEEGMLDYIERTIQPGKGALLMRRSAELFQDIGVDVLNRSRRCLNETEKESLAEFFERTARLYQDGRLLWPHGRFSDPEQVRKMLNEHRITFFCRQRGGEAPEFLTSDFVQLPYPHGKKAMIVPIVAVLDRRTCFVEEALRLVKKLRSAEQQTAAMKTEIFQPLHRQVLPDEMPLTRYFRNKTVEFRRNIDPVEIRLVDFIMSWELLYNMTGRRSGNSVDLLDKKIRYYYANADKYKEQIKL